MIRVVIADDEPLARNRIRRLLSGDKEVEIVAECKNGKETVAALDHHQPDLLFLDVEMPEVDGFGVLEQVGAENMPVVIFVTAYDQYAVQAFETHALDYLLKPFDEERFHKALQRARFQVERSRTGEITTRLLAMLHDVRPQPMPASDRLVIKSGGRVVFLKSEEIDWVEAAANYVRIHTGSEEYLMRETMNAFEAKLDSRRFMRIHRSIIVNLEKIRELQPCNNGEYIVVLRTGKELSLSRSFRDRIQDYLRRSPTFLRGSSNSMQSTA
ncbi:MAG TPA: LytTR family DNA-binding domain-containing protein [Terriglobales bacterium]|nr:LytTR family DNA-binding domain-containing protein [Terriglobales bacterium]